MELFPRETAPKDTMAGRPLTRILRAFAITLAILLLGTTSVGPLHGQMTDPPVPISALQGAWEGLGADMVLKMTLTATGETTVEGEVQFFRFDRGSSVAEQPASWYRVRGTYDPDLLSFSLEPTEWVEEPRPRGRQMHALVGVFDPRRPALAGEVELPRPPAGRPAVYFVLARPNQAGELIRAVGGEPSRRVRTRMPDDAGLVRWASRLTEEYPGLNPARALGRAFVPITFNLFEDDYFRAHFGLTFDQMNARQREAVRQRFQQRPSPELQRFARLQGAFRTGGRTPPRYREYVLPVMAQRVIRGWRDVQLARMEALQPTASTIRELQALAEAGEAHLRPLWPNEWSHFQQAYDESRDRLIAPALAISLDELVAREPGYDLAVALAVWGEVHADVIALIPHHTRAELRARLVDRLDRVLALLMTHETRALTGLGSGLAAVTAGNRWYADLRERYGFGRERPPILQAVARLQERRPHDLAAASADLTRRIQRLQTTAEVRELLRTTLAVPGDYQTESGRALGELAAQRTETWTGLPSWPGFRRTSGNCSATATGSLSAQPTTRPTGTTCTGPCCAPMSTPAVVGWMPGRSASPISPFSS